MAKIQYVLGRSGGITYTKFWWLKHFIKKHKFLPSPKRIHLTLKDAIKTIITRQLVSQNPFATPVTVYVAAQWNNMASQVLVNTDSGNGTKLLPKSVFTLSSIRFPPGGGGGTPYVMGDTYVPRFWPPFFTLAGSSTIFLGYFFSSTNTKTIFWGTKTTNS